jgi:predicted CoA-binding protein
MGHQKTCPQALQLFEPVTATKILSVAFFVSRVLRAKKETDMQTPTDKTVVILGISDKPDRYSFKAAKMLAASGYHSLIGVAPNPVSLPEVRYEPSLGAVQGPVDTLTLYVNPQLARPMIEDIVELAPRRIIMNPGAECPELAHEAQQKGIEVLEACTLVLLSTNQF